jgi:DNA-binding response OmpR family regulator
MATILVIEDEDALREAVLDLLRGEGHEPLEAENGRIGVDLARAIAPDLIICDVRMPVLDGFGVLTELRRNPETATIPFIFLTASTSKEQFRHGMTLGADDYVTKPFDHDELLAAVNTRLEKQAAVRKAYEKRLNTFQQALVYTLPHEFRTPLTAILGYAEIISMDCEHNTIKPAQTLAMAQAIVQAGNRLRRLVENYLLYAQLDIIRTEPDRIALLRRQVTAHPGDEVSQIALRLARDAGRASDLTLQIINEPVRISVENLGRIVEEVIGNAFKFSRAGSAVEVRMFSVGAMLAIRVADAGRGMTPEQIGAIGAHVQFERRLYEQQGAGMGLINARRLAELHEGMLTIDSVYGSGTRVTVRLPLSIEQAPGV